MRDGRGWQTNYTPDSDEYGNSLELCLATGHRVGISGRESGPPGLGAQRENIAEGARVPVQGLRLSPRPPGPLVYKTPNRFSTLLDDIPAVADLEGL